MQWPYQRHQAYNRRRDIHAVYSGQERGGITTPAGVPGVFIFTGPDGLHHGYEDGYNSDGTFRFTGEGQFGPMIWQRGNKAIRDHFNNRKDLLLFSKRPDGDVDFEGLFYCEKFEVERQLDTAGQERDAFVFILAPIERLERQADNGELPNPTGSLSDLRKLAIAAATGPQAGSAGATTIYQRSKQVRDYVLKRANGICEGCKSPAPFKTKVGRPYLEPHHIFRLSDGGPDHPSFVAGICPNCHRMAHYSADAAKFNSRLVELVAAAEDLIRVDGQHFGSLEGPS